MHPQTLASQPVVSGGHADASTAKQLEGAAAAAADDARALTQAGLRAVLGQMMPDAEQVRALLHARLGLAVLFATNTSHEVID